MNIWFFSARFVDCRSVEGNHAQYDRYLYLVLAIIQCALPYSSTWGSTPPPPRIPGYSMFKCCIGSSLVDKWHQNSRLGRKFWPLLPGRNLPVHKKKSKTLFKTKNLATVPGRTNIEYYIYKNSLDGVSIFEFTLGGHAEDCGVNNAGKMWHACRWAESSFCKDIRWGETDFFYVWTVSISNESVWSEWLHELNVT